MKVRCGVCERDFDGEEPLGKVGNVAARDLGKGGSVARPKQKEAGGVALRRVICGGEAKFGEHGVADGGRDRKSCIQLIEVEVFRCGAVVDGILGCLVSW